MFDSKIFGERVRKLRNDEKISQTALGNNLGIGKSAVSMVESGQRSASIEVATQIANYFDVPLDYLLGRGPFACWDKVMKHHDYICKQIVKEEPFWNDFPVPLDKLSERQFMAVVGATLDNIEYKEKDGQEHFTLTFFPLYV